MTCRISLSEKREQCLLEEEIKMESIRKLSNQWTKTLYQNNLKHITFFFTLFKSYRRNTLSVITPKTISSGSL